MKNKKNRENLKKKQRENSFKNLENDFLFLVNILLHQIILSAKPSVYLTSQKPQTQALNVKRKRKRKANTLLF